MAVTARERGPALEPYDEAFGPDGEPRPHYRALLEALDGVDLAALRHAVNARVEREGVTFTTSEGEQAFVVDPSRGSSPRTSGPRSPPASSGASGR